MRFSTSKRGFLAATLALFSFAATTSANDGLTSNAIIHRAGLTIEWYTHAGVGATGGLSDWHITVDENKPTTYFSIQAENYREKFSENTLNPFGVPYGVQGAREYAALRADVLKAELANDGRQDVKVSVSEYMLPATTVYVLTSNAKVQAIDGDTGEIKWATPIGRSTLPSIGVGANDKYVAAINGATLYCLDVETGKVEWQEKCRYAASASPTVSEEKIFVPLLNGRLEAFDLANKGFNSYAFVSKGQGTARPVVTEKTVAWPTNEGDLNVAAQYGGKRGVAYQLKSDASIVCPPAYKNGVFYVTSLDGFLYALDEERGAINWQISTGHAISQAPVVLGGFVFAINDKNDLYKIDAKTGVEAPGWESPRPNVRRFIGAGKENMYVVDQFDRLAVMNQKTGTILSAVPMGRVKSILPNLQNDRLYMVSDRGMIQCIREIASPVPHFHSNEFVAVEVDADGMKARAAGDIPRKPGEVDLDDPFGGGQPAATDDPFGGSGAADNPFGGPPAKGGAVDKGSDDDPFK